MKKVIFAISEGVDRVARFILFLLVGLAFLCTIYQVFSRYVLLGSWIKGLGFDLSGLNFTWMEEAIRYLFVWIVFLGVGVVYRVRGHAQVEILTKVLSKNWRKVFLIGIEIMNAVFFAILFDKGYELMQITNGQLSPSLGLNMSIMYISILACSLICFIHSLHFIVYMLSEKEKVQGQTAKISVEKGGECSWS